jgi:crossover junction endodeoxyribonuclease RuvC
MTSMMLSSSNSVNNPDSLTARDGEAAQARLRVLGIDPGLADVGFGVIDWDGQASAASLVRHGVIRTQATETLAQRLDHIFTRLSALIEEIRPDVVVIEELFFAKNVKTAMVVAHGRAACILATARRRVKLCEYTPLQIKQALTGHGRAGKQQVQWMVRAVLRLDEIPKPDHAADALAAALCHVHSLSLGEKIDRAEANEITNLDLLAQNPNKLLLAQMKTRRRRRR